MDINEFSIACKLINLKLRQFEIPKVLPPVLIASLSAVGGTPTLTPSGAGSLSPMDPLKTMTSSIPPARPPMPPQPMMPMASVIQTVPSVPMMPAAMQPPIMPPAMQQQPLIPGMDMNMGMGVPPPLIPITPALIPGSAPIKPPPPVQQTQPAIAGYGHILPNTQPNIIANNSLIGIDLLGNPLPVAHVAAPSVLVETTQIPTSLPAPPTPPSGTPSRTMSISDKVPSIDSPGSVSGQLDWAIKSQSKLKYTQIFNTTDRTRSGFLTGAQARNLMVQTKLPQATLALIWALSDMDSDGRLGCEEFVLAMYLCEMASMGEQIPTKLPPELIPPSFRKGVSRHGSIVGSSRHGSVSSQGAPVVDIDPLAGLPGQSK